MLGRRRSTCSTARTSSTRAASPTGTSSSTCSRASSPFAGARGVVVFDGVGEERDVGPLAVRFAPNADTLLERLAAERRDREVVLLVTSDAAVQGTSGQEVRKRGSVEFLAELRAVDASRGRARAGSASGSTPRREPASSGCAAGLP